MIQSKLLKVGKSLYERRLSDEQRLIRSPSRMNKIYLTSIQVDGDAAPSPSPLPSRSDNIRSTRSQNGSVNRPDELGSRNTQKSASSSKVRRLRNGFMPLLPLVPEIPFSHKSNSRSGGEAKKVGRNISPILSRGSQSLDSDQDQQDQQDKQDQQDQLDQCSSISWEEEDGAAFDPEFKVGGFCL